MSTVSEVGDTIVDKDISRLAKITSGSWDMIGVNLGNSTFKSTATMMFADENRIVNRRRFLINVKMLIDIEFGYPMIILQM